MTETPANETVFACPFGEIALLRHPLIKHPSMRNLRAWDAADEYLLQYTSELQLPTNSKVLLLNDQFGALTLALNEFQLIHQSDSQVAQTACKLNLERNHIDDMNLLFLDSLKTVTDIQDLILIKIPKSLAMLEDQLYRLRQAIGPQTQIVGAAMTRHLPSRAIDLFQTILGETTTSLARKKARLVICQPQPEFWNGASPFPNQYVLENTSVTLINHANVFSQRRLDIGTRFLLERLPETQGNELVVDLACGNGILGLMIKSSNPSARVLFTDESYMAVASAQTNVVNALGSAEGCKFKVQHSLDNTKSDCADLIINNPPFHQQTAIGDFIAWAMFSDARRVLKPGGRLVVVANRHLNYHSKLKKLFGNCTVIGANRKFTILMSSKSH